MTLTPDRSRPLPDRLLELAEERVSLSKRVADRGGVRVASRTELVEEAIHATLAEQAVEVERVPVGRFVEAAEAPRTETDAEGEVTILPVYEERIVVETRLFLVEEVRLRRRTAQRDVEVPVQRRRQVAEVTRLPPLDDAITHQGEITMPSDYTSSTGSTGYGSGAASGSSRTVTALFDTSAEAERAVERLRRAGVPDSSIRVTAGGSYDQATYQDQHKGFWDGLADFFFPDEDRYAYAEGLSRGAQLVTVSNFDAGMHETIVDILDDEGSVDLDARESEWRSSGSYTDYQSSSYYNEDEYSRTHGRSYGSGAGLGSGLMAAGSAAADAAGRASSTMGSAVDSAMGGAGSRGTINDDGTSDRAGAGSYQMAADASGSSFSGTRVGTDYGSDRAFDRDLNDDGTVKVVEERLAVGKREAEAGAVRVRSYVREVPVEASVDLRSTRVFIDRRPVDRAVSSADVAFQDRTIEAREHVEEAVVGKEARVVEEIGLREETEARTETVRDTVRKTEVEIEDERTGETTRVTGSGTASGTGGMGGTGSSGY